MRIKLPVLSRVCGILFILLSISTFTTYGADRTHIDWLSSGFPKQITDQVTGLKLQFNYDRYERPYSIISSDGETKRTWQYSYIDVEGYFAPVTAQAPYNDSRTVIKYSYDGRGNLGSITNELGHVVTFSQRSPQGDHVAQIIDENGIKTDLDYRYIVYEDSSKSKGYATYHKHPQSVTINGNTTQYEYDDKDRLIYKKTPAGVTYRYEYDDRIIYSQTPAGVAHPQKNIVKQRVKDGFGNVLQKELDAQGNVIETRIKDARGNLVYQLKHSDTVASAAQGKEQDDANEYPKHKVVLNYDEAERITSIRSVYAENKTSNTSDDSVIPQQETQTHYTYNAWDEITRITTAGKGMTSFSYNEAGQLVKQKDNMGQEYGYGYDVLNRLTKVSINHKPILLYVYDQGQYGKGYFSEVTRLPSAIQGAANTIRNSYDAFGNIGTQTNIINEKEYRIIYTYNEDNQINTITYPSGLTVYYAHNTLGKVDKLSINKPPFIVAKDIEHLPFGPITTLTYGNGYIQENGYDLRYRLTERNLKNIAHDHYRYDENGNISEIIHVSAPEWNTRYRYDRLDRLTAVESPKHRQIFTYKRAGEIDVDIKDLQHDLNGNLTWLNGLSLSYDEFNLLTEVRNQDKTVASYQYNGQGQRVLKTVDGKETVFIYDQFLNVIEIISEGETTDIIYLEGQPLAQMTQGQIDYFINDVQGTPERLIDQRGNTRWQADIQPFEIQETIKEIRQNLRFPGQYYDEETGFYYNGSRHYSPQLRSYIQPDPLDPLSGGSIDAYAYAENNPVNIVDPLGLCPSCHYNINCREYQADPLGALARHFGWQFLSYCYGTVTAFGGGFVNEISFGLTDFSYDDRHQFAHYAGLIAANVLGGIPKAGLSATVRGGKAMAKVALPRVVKESGAVPRKVSSGAENVNAQSALRAKLSGLEKAQQNAATTRQLPDGRVRYYTQEVPARTEGPTRGASFVTEHNPQNGNVRQWMESYDHAGSVNRVHPKSINGQTVNSQHYPPVTRELGL